MPFPAFTISTSGKGIALLNGDTITFNANDNDDAVNLIFNPAVDFSKVESILLDMTGQGLLDIKLYSM